MQAETPICVRFEDLTLGYERHPAVHHLSGVVPMGALLAVVGPNGAGKSTLLKGLAGELRPLGGRIYRPAPQTGGVAYLAQRAELDESFPVSVFELVAMGLWREIGAFGGLSRRQRADVLGALNAVGLTAFADRPIGSLSGGQLQRARFARLILQNAPLVLLDEPFAAIDSRTVDDLVGVVQTWHREGRTVLCVVHDLEQVRRLFPSCLLLAREPVAFGPTSQVLTPALLARARQLSEAFDETAEECRRPPLGGDLGGQDDADGSHAGHSHAGHSHPGHIHAAHTPAQPGGHAPVQR